MVEPMPFPYELPTPAAAKALLGARLFHGPVAGTIVETEAYTAENDPACHAFCGRTARTEVMWGEGGLAYVYLCYGLHWCLNAVAHAPGKGGAVLIRAVALDRGIEIARKRRRRDDPAERLASGPARLTQAFGVSGKMNGWDMKKGEFRIEPAKRPPGRIVSGPQIGITKAREKRWRFWISGHPAVSS
jgi:DNA-3-methyladenine glycosylase